MSTDGAAATRAALVGRLRFIRLATRLALAAAGWILLGGCGDAAGRLSVDFVWEEPPVDTVWVRVVVEERTDPTLPGVVLAAAPPVAYDPGGTLAFDLGRIPAGDERYVIAEVRSGAALSLRVIAYGISRPFSIGPNQTARTPVPLVIGPPQSEAVPPTLQVLVNGGPWDYARESDLKLATLRLTFAAASRVQIGNGEDLSVGLIELPTDDPSLSCHQIAGPTPDTPLTQCDRTRWDLVAGRPAEDGAAFVVGARLIDRFGYASETLLDTVVLDKKPVNLRPGTISLERSDQDPLANLGPDHVVVRPTDYVLVSVSTDEPLAEAPTVGAGANAWDVAQWSPDATDFQAIIGPFEFPGTYDVSLQLRDRRGDTNALALGIIDVDATPPDGLTEAEAASVILRRAPYGSAATAGAGQTSLVVCPDGCATPPFEGDTRITLFAAILEDDPDLRDGALEHLRWKCGTIPLVRDAPVFGLLGPQAIDLGGDVPAVCVFEEDRAGNRSATTLVRYVEWVAVADKSVPENPTRAILRPVDGPERLEGPAPFAVWGADAIDNQSYGLITGGGRWVARTGTRSAPRSVYAATTDYARRRVIVYGEAPAVADPDAPFGGAVWEWDGRAGVQSALAAAATADGPKDSVAWSPRSGRLSFGGIGTALAWDPAAEEVFQVGGDGDWISTPSADGSLNFITLTNLADGDPRLRSLAAAATDFASGRVYMYGGLADARLRCLDDLWAWDGSRFALLDAGGDGAPGPRGRHDLALDPLRGRLVLFGGDLGCVPGAVSGDTWEWDGGGWQLVAPGGPDGPPPRSGAAMAWDPNLEALLLVGGFDADGAALSDLWTWDGATWRAIQAPAVMTEPPPRTRAAMAWDGQSGDLILFGGRGASDGQLRADTWRYDGDDWVVDGDATGPPGREWHQLGWDFDTEQLILFGGTGAGGVLGDTWRWTANGWVEVPAPSDDTPWPQARTRHALFWDGTRGSLLLYGGVTSAAAAPTKGDALADLWEWDGAGWLPVTTDDPEDDGAPPASAEPPVIVWDPVDEHAVATVGDQKWIFANNTWRRLLGTSSFSGDALAAYDPGHRTIVRIGDFVDRDSGTAASEWRGDGWDSYSLGDAEGDGDPGNVPPAAAATDWGRGVIVYLRGGTTAPYTWEYDGAADRTAALRITTPLSEARPGPLARLTEARLRVVAQGEAGPTESRAYGVEVHGWSETGWVPVGEPIAHEAGAWADFEARIDDPEVVGRMLFGDDRELSMRVRPSSPRGARGQGRMKVDYLEMSARYRLAEASETRCDDGRDDDGDLEVDCADLDCQGRGGCGEEEVCGDGVDNDGDGDRDCADSQCVGADGCDFTETACGDGWDDDGDGLIDCADWDCREAPTCEGGVQRCADQIDNDGDGATDCEDVDCICQAGCGGRETGCCVGDNALSCGVDGEPSLTQCACGWRSDEGQYGCTDAAEAAGSSDPGGAPLLCPLVLGVP